MKRPMEWPMPHTASIDDMTHRIAFLECKANSGDITRVSNASFNDAISGN